jgi:hypothetical protein
MRARSSVDRAPASGAGSGGSIPLGRTIQEIGTFDFFESAFY